MMYGTLADMPSASGPEATLPAKTRKRIEQLESTVSELGGMLSALAIQLEKRGFELRLETRSPLLARILSRPRAKKEADARTRRSAAGQRATAATAHAAGLAAANLRGEAAKVEWVRSGEVVSAKELAEAWGLTPQALGPAAKRGEVFAVTVKNQRYYPREFLHLERDEVGTVCKRLEGMDPSEQLIFWKRKHGALGGKTVYEALSNGKRGGPRLLEVVELAHAYAAPMRANAAQAA